MNWLDTVRWDAQGLVPVIAQEASTGDVLMFAWMNREALQQTAELRRAVYFSRSRNKLWFKGEESGHVQTVHEIRLDGVTAASSVCSTMATGKYPSRS
jgi:phosphoribosyl-AMP cyclohydrolase